LSFQGGHDAGYIPLIQIELGIFKNKIGSLMFGIQPVWSFIFIGFKFIFDVFKFWKLHPSNNCFT